MNYKFLIVFSFFSTNLFSQKIVVVDKASNFFIPYVAIEMLGEKDGIYANNRGEFDLDIIQSDSIRVSHMSYIPINLKIKKIRDTIFLYQKIEALSEIQIKSEKSKKLIGYIKKKKNLSWHIKPKTELVTLIKYRKKIINALIDKIFIPIGKESFIRDENEFKNIFPKFNTVFRISIYSNNDNKPGKRLLNSVKTIVCTEKSDDILKIDLSEEFIEFSEEGVFIGVEMIGEFDEEKKNKSNQFSILPSFKFTKKSLKNIISSTYIKSLFLENKWVNIKNRKEFNQVAEYNMAISLELKIYD